RQIRILTADNKGSVHPTKNTFFGRATFNHSTLSLRISPVSVADSGVYRAETESSTGDVPAVKFCVSVWEHFSIVPWWAVAVVIGLVLTVSIILVATCCRRRRKRRREPPEGHAEQMLTVYEEVGKAQTSQAPNQSCAATVEGNTVYTVVWPRTQARTPNCPLEPESCTIYSKIQPTKKSPSLRRKKLDRSLVSTAYLEVTGTGLVAR
ncbi:PREDICTED: natural killer cell receptor 2B4, partial [Apaloderma vittatum]|uniref:natural killer cell receptor 2B4 n=1 Tax=Apaloderma vittatum TaxID=57397 RepID=UPI0005216D99